MLVIIKLASLKQNYDMMSLRLEKVIWFGNRLQSVNLA